MCINSILQIRWYAIIFISILISFGYAVFIVRVYTCTLVILLWFHLLLSGRWISFLYCSRHSVRIFCSLILESLIFYNKTHILYYLICLLFQSKSSFPPWIIVFFLFIRCSDVFTYWPHCRINIKLKIQICHQTLCATKLFPLTLCARRNPHRSNHSSIRKSTVIYCLWMRTLTASESFRSDVVEE